MPPAPPKLPSFSKLAKSAIKNDGSMMSNPVTKSLLVAPLIPSKMSSNRQSSMEFSNEALTASRRALKPVQPPNSNPSPTQLYGKPEAAESEHTPEPIKAVDLGASNNTLGTMPQITRPPVSMPQTNQRSYKPMQRPSEAKQTSQVAKNEGSAVINLARCFDNNPIKTPILSNPMLSEFAVISQRRKRINNVNWDEFDKSARKL